MADRQQQAGQGARASRRRRADYSGILAALRAGENAHPNPDTPDRSGGSKRRRWAAAEDVQPAAAQPEKLEEHKAAAAQAADQQPPEQAADGPAPEPPQRPANRLRSAAAAAVAATAQAEEMEADMTEPGWDRPSAKDADPERAGDGVASSSTAATAAGAAPPQQQRKKRQRVLVDVHGGGGPAAAAAAAAGGTRQLQPEDVQNEYERQRLERIRRNEQMLQQLGIADAAGGLAAAVAAEQRLAAGSGGAAGAGSRPQPRPRERRPAVPAAALPVRASKRQRGERAPVHEEAVAEAVAELGAGKLPHPSAASDTDPEHGALLDLERYFEMIGQDISGAVHSDGRFSGWVNPAVCQRYGVPTDADAAWEAGGGGTFSFKIDKKAIPASLKGRGWSDARAFSHTQLVKNPNSYFYRHVAPHEQQAQGEWTEEEHRLFVETARAHGVGDKWGLFASYLPQRVGYQCSAYYRDVIIPQGLVMDKRYKMTLGGRAVFVG